MHTLSLMRKSGCSVSLFMPTALLPTKERPGLVCLSSAKNAAPVGHLGVGLMQSSCLIHGAADERKILSKRILHKEVMAKNRIARGTNPDIPD
jgi:hypothetical protein